MVGGLKRESHDFIGFSPGAEFSLLPMPDSESLVTMSPGFLVPIFQFFG
jgi:hypothetical protein